MNTTYFKNDNFILKISEKDGKICETKFVRKISDNKNSTNKLLKQTIKELEEYTSGKRKKFSVPLDIQGTDFQKKVWKQMLKIPYGKTLSYKEVADLIKSPKSARAVGNACGKNNLPVIIPCHRVVSMNSLGGFMGGFLGGMKIKKYLLKLENYL